MGKILPGEDTQTTITTNSTLNNPSIYYIINGKLKFNHVILLSETSVAFCHLSDKVQTP